MLKDKSVLLDGPIPGANYTSDTKNYPWHRPPDFTNLDDAIEDSVKKLTRKKSVFGLISMMQNGMTLAAATDTFVTAGIAKGKWTPDFAILIAGPIARIIKMLADGYGIEYKTGLEYEDASLTTGTMLGAMLEVTEEKSEDVGAEVASKLEDIQEEADALPESTGGLMGATPEMLAQPAGQEEQDSMLGYGPEDDQEEVLV